MTTMKSSRSRIGEILSPTTHALLTLIIEMELLQERMVSCPYCGETLEVLLDAQDAGDEYIEDCQVCCKPIIFNVYGDSHGDLSVSVRDENE